MSLSAQLEDRLLDLRTTAGSEGHRSAKYAESCLLKDTQGASVVAGGAGSQGPNRHHVEKLGKSFAGDALAPVGAVYPVGRICWKIASRSVLSTRRRATADIQAHSPHWCADPQRTCLEGQVVCVLYGISGMPQRSGSALSKRAHAVLCGTQSKGKIGRPPGLRRAVAPGPSRPSTRSRSSGAPGCSCGRGAAAAQPRSSWRTADGTS
jgi:hypothetical protein